MVEIDVETGSLLLGAPEAQVVLLTTPPLFVVATGSLSAWDSLLAELRLSGATGASGALPLIQRAVLDARMRFFRSLGESRVSYLAAIPYVVNPTTINQTLRAVASSTEILIIRHELLRKLRWSTIDGNAVQQIYNSEAFIREQPEAQLETELKRLHNEIEENMELLAGDEQVGEETQGLLVMTPEPTTPPPKPGSSVWPHTVL